jgi:hypothetical protein
VDDRDAALFPSTACKNLRFGYGGKRHRRQRIARSRYAEGSRRAQTVSAEHLFCLEFVDPHGMDSALILG